MTARPDLASASLIEALAREIAPAIAPAIVSAVVEELRKQGVEVKTRADILTEHGDTMTTRQVAEALGVRERTVWNMVERGELSHPRTIRNKARFSTDEVRGILNEKQKPR